MRTEGPKRLADWMKTRTLSQRALAEMLGLSQQSVSQWLRRIARPDADQREAIAALTDGAVPVSAWRTPREAARLAALRPPAAA